MYSSQDQTLNYHTLWNIVGWLWIVLLVYFSLETTLPEPATVLNDKLLHFTAYFFVMIWFVQIYLDKRKILTIAVFLILLGFLLEWMQGSIDARDGNLLDGLVNGIGVVLASLLFNTPLSSVFTTVERYINDVF